MATEPPRNGPTSAIASSRLLVSFDRCDAMMRQPDIARRKMKTKAFLRWLDQSKRAEMRLPT